MRVLASFLIGLYSPFVFSTHHENAFSVSPLWGYDYFGEAVHTEDHSMPLLAFSYDLTPQVGMEFLIGDTKSERTRPSLQNGETDTEESIYFFNAIYHFRKDKAFQPYLTGGLGINRLTNNDYDTSGETAADLGIGAEYFFINNIALRGDVRDINIFYDNRNDILASIGLTLLF